jgi:hypothetical protein
MVPPLLTENPLLALTIWAPAFTIAVPLEPT